MRLDATVNQGPDVSRPQKHLQLSSKTQPAWYLHGARLAVADIGRPSQDVDGFGNRKCLVGLVLREVFQAALIGLLVLVLGGQTTGEGNQPQPSLF